MQFSEGASSKVKLTQDQKQICAMTGVSPDKVLARMSAEKPDGSIDPDADGDEQDEIDRAQNHLECCRDEGEDTMSRVSMARDCLNDFLAKSGGEVKTGSANSAGIVFAHHQR
jgi:hypothetical protein